MRKNFIYNVIYQVLSLIIPIITIPYLARTLGVNAIGIFSYKYSVVSFFTIVAVFGTTTYGQRLVAYSRDDREKLSKAFSSVFMLRCITTFLILLIYAVFIILTPEYNQYYLLLSLNIINVIFDITWFYQGVENFKMIVTRNTFVKLINLISIFTLIHDEKDLDIYILIYCGFTVIGNISTWFGLKKRVDFTVKVSPFKDIKSVLQLFIPSIAMQVYTLLDKLMIGWITKSTYENGCFEQAEKICRIAITVVAAIAIVIAPRISNLYNKFKNGEVNKDKIHNLVYKGIRIVCMLAFPIMLGMISVTPVFVPVFLGAGYDQVLVLLPIFSVLVLVVGLANVIGVAFLIPIEKQNIYTIAIITSAIANLILNLILIPVISSTGAALASVIAETLGLIIQFVYCFKYEHFNIVAILKDIWRYIVSSMIMLAVLFLARTFVPINIIGLLLLIVCGAVVYGIILLILRDEFVMNNLKIVVEKLHIRRL